MKKRRVVSFSWLSVGILLVNIFGGNVNNKTAQVENNPVCKRKVLWRMRMCSSGKIVCSKNKEYVNKANHYVKALSSANPTKRIKASYKLMKIAPYILPYLKKEYKKARNLEQKNGLIVYGSLNLTKDVEIRIMCEDGKGGFMWYAVISKGTVSGPLGNMRTALILVGNEKGVIRGIQVRTGSNEWNVGHYSCDLRDESRTKFAIEIWGKLGGGGDTFVVTGNWYYRNSRLFPSTPKNFYIILKRENLSNKGKVIIDGKEIKKYEEIWGWDVVFSQNGQRYGFIAKKENGKWVAVIDGKESKEYEEIKYLLFSANGQRYGFVAKKNNGKWVAVIDGRESKEYDEIWYVVLSPNGQRYGFVAKKDNGKKWIAVVDDKESKEYDSISNFVIERQRYGFVGKDGNEEIIIIDGEETKERWFFVTDLTFSPDNKHYAYIGVKNTGEVVAVVNGKKSKEYSGMFNLQFSPNSQQFGFVAKKGPIRQVAVINDKESEEYANIELGSFRFSPSGTRYGFVAQKINGMYVVVLDGKESEEYSRIEKVGNFTETSNLKWSLDDKVAGFIGRLKREEGSEERCELVINGKPFVNLNCALGFYFYKNTLKYIEFRNNKIYKVTCHLKG